MKTNIDLDRLAESLKGRGLGYLITADSGWRTHTVPVVPVFDGGVVHVESIGGRHTRANLEHSRHVTVLWPPPEPDDYSVIVDGHAEVSGNGDAPVSLRLVPGRAVLIRPATPKSPGETACGHDCLDLALASV